MGKRKRTRSSARKPMFSLHRAVSIRGPRRGIRRSKRKTKVGMRAHKFSRYGANSTYTVTAGTSESDFGQHFTFDQINGYTEFTSLFDRYRIDCVVLKFQLITNPDAAYQPASTATANPGNYYPKLWWCFDRDDANPINLAAMKERGNAKCKVLRPNQMISIVIRPNILSLTYRTALTSGYVPKPRQFIDALNADVPHYGFKHIIEHPFTTATANQYIVNMDRKFYFTMKDLQ